MKKTKIKRLKIYLSIFCFLLSIQKLNGVVRSELEEAFKKNDRNKIEYILEKTELEKEELNKVLIWAIDNNNTNIIKLAINKGADVNIKNKDGNTALIIAASDGSLFLVELLLSKGANINDKNIKGDTALHISCQKFYKDIVKILLDNKADVNKANNAGNTPLLVVVSQEMKWPLEQEIIDMLLGKGVDVNQVNTRNGSTALIIATRKGYFNVVRHLINKGADVHKKDNDGNTALIEAAKKGSTGIVELLIKNGADINVQNKRNENPLNLALLNNRMDIANILLNQVNIKIDKTIVSRISETLREKALNLKGYSIFWDDLYSQVEPVKKEVFSFSAILKFIFDKVKDIPNNELVKILNDIIFLQEFAKTYPYTSWIREGKHFDPNLEAKEKKYSETLQAIKDSILKTIPAKARQYEIISAHYGSDNKIKDVTNILKKKYKNKEFIFEGGHGSMNNLFGDPAPGIRKKLIIKYKSPDGKKNTKTIEEDHLFSIP